jgi:hypothetical protein
MVPTTDSRLGVISTQAGRTALASACDGGTSTVLTGPLMQAMLRRAERPVQRKLRP